MQFTVYGLGCCSCPNAALKISKLETNATLAGRAFHGTVPSGKNEYF